MELCVVSGKGGTGKTTVAVGLAVALAAAGEQPVHLLDCDVEAPNAHLYLRPESVTDVPATVRVPQWDAARCSHCGECVAACAFGSLGLFGSHLEIFTEHCHSCAACVYVCADGALGEVSRPIGSLHRATAAGVELAWGTLNVGEPRAVPIIEALRDAPAANAARIIDGPPGTACSLVAAARGADAALIVTEPTPFGLHDLRLAAEVLAVLDVPAAVVINKSGADPGVREYCAANGLPILLELPLDATIARAGAAGIPLPVSHPEYSDALCALWSTCAARAQQERVA